MNDMHGVAMNRDELIRSLAQVIAGDGDLLLDGWKHLVLVSQVDDGTPDLTGFCYTADGRAVPVSPTDFSIFDVIEDRNRVVRCAIRRLRSACEISPQPADTADPTSAHCSRWRARPSSSGRAA